MKLVTVIVTRSKSCTVKTLHSVLRINMRCIQKKIDNQIVYINDDPYDKAEIVEKCMKSHDRIILLILVLVSMMLHLINVSRSMKV